ncbi:MAG TPA: YncE family protein [Candidatus Angelobacter sp.]
MTFSLSKTAKFAPIVLLVSQLINGGPQVSDRFRYQATDHGIAVEADISPVDNTTSGALHEDDDVTIKFRLSYADGNHPVRGVFVRAWMQATSPSDSQSCTATVSHLLNSETSRKRAELDLNSYYVLALNADATITVVDPLFGYGGTKLLSLIPLAGVGEDWVLAQDRDRLYVTLPDARQIAVIDTRTWKVIAAISMPARPRRVSIQPDRSQIWITLESSKPEDPGLAVLDAGSLRLAATLPAGPGGHTIAFSADNHWAAVTNSANGTISLMDIQSKKVRTIPSGAEPVSIAFSPLSKMFYVSDHKEGSIVAIEPESGRQAARIKAEPGLGQIKFAPGGRLGFVVNPETNLLYIFDSSNNQLFQTARMDGGPDQIVFSDQLAYVRQRNSETVMVVPLSIPAKKGAPLAVADFPGGQHNFGDVALPSPADGFAPAPGENAVLVANPADKAIYYYEVGMAAPQGSFSNYSREPRAILVVDRSLKPAEPGIYRTTARLPHQGVYSLAMLVDNPRVVQCFPVKIEAKSGVAAHPKPKVEFAKLKGPLQAGHAAHLQFRLIDPATGALQGNRTDVRVMITLQSLGWSNPSPQFAVPEGNGVYGFDFVPPFPGHYTVLVECIPIGLPIYQSPQLQLEVSQATGSPLSN